VQVTKPCLEGKIECEDYESVQVEVERLAHIFDFDCSRNFRWHSSTNVDFFRSEGVVASSDSQLHRSLEWLCTD
jgi:hypothetical protein